MANTPSALKAMRQDVGRAKINLQVKKAYKEAMKNALKAITAGEKDMAEKVTFAQKKLDKAAKRGVIKDNTASRKHSRLMKKLNAAKKA